MEILLNPKVFVMAIIAIRNPLCCFNRAVFLPTQTMLTEIMQAAARWTRRKRCLPRTMRTHTTTFHPAVNWETTELDLIPPNHS